MMAFRRWNYASIKDFPEGCTIQKQGKRLYVIERKYTYDPFIKRGKEKRRIVGQVIDNVFHPRTDIPKSESASLSAKSQTSSFFSLEQFKSAPVELIEKAVNSDIEIINLGALPIFYTLMSGAGITEDLYDAFGKEDGNLIFAMAACFLETGKLSPSTFIAWQASHYLPSARKADLDKVNLLFKKISLTSPKTQKFFLARASRNKRGPFSAIVVPVQSSGTHFPAWQPTRNKDVSSQEYMLVILNSRTSLPVLEHVITSPKGDLAALVAFASEIGSLGLGQVEHFALGEDFFSENSLIYANASDTKGMFLLSERKGIEFKNAIQSRNSTAKKEAEKPIEYDSKPKSEVWRHSGKTIKISGHHIKIWFHEFKVPSLTECDVASLRDRLLQFESLWTEKEDLRHHLEQSPLLNYFHIVPIKQKGVNKSKLAKDPAFIKDRLEKCGTFAIAANWDCSLQNVYQHLLLRAKFSQIVEKTISATTPADSPFVFADPMNGKLFISFIGFLILELLENSLERQRRQKSPSEENEKEMGVDPNTVITALSSFSYLKRKASKTFVPMALTAEQAKVAKACGFQWLYQTPYKYQ